MATPNPTWYDILGVGRDASPDEIKAAWRAATDKFEPGQGSSQFRLFNEAADVLLDPDRRAAYDAELAGEPGGVSLAKLEVEQAKAEIGQMMAETAGGVAFIAAGVFIGLIAIATLDVVLILAFHALFEWMNDIALTIFFGVVFLVLLVLYIPLMGTFTGGQRAALVIGFIALAAAFAVPARFLADDGPEPAPVTAVRRLGEWAAPSPERLPRI